MYAGRTRCAHSPELTYEQPGQPVVVGELVLTAIERISIRHHQAAGRVFFAASKRPIAVLVRTGDREWRIEVPRD